MELHLTLIFNGLATGMLIFLLAAGLSLIFGLMSVLNFAHGALFMFGAYMGTWVYILIGGWNSPWGNLNFFVGMIAAALIGVVLGYLVERFTVRQVYGNHLRQILITTGVMLVVAELVKVFWGPNLIRVVQPEFLQGHFLVGDVRLTYYRVFIILFSTMILILLLFMLKKSKIGVVVRAGVENSQMVQALGINIRKVFTLVFIFGTMLACIGGYMWGPFQGQVNPGMGLDLMLIAFIVVAIGGLGSVAGSAIAAVLVGLSEAYMAYYFPPGSLAVNMLIMAAVLLIKPTGLLGAGR
ncbi:branched-chain amino acid transport system permease protein [Evansella vedderi]|uniref:Branched-chain amino acid transport system permease protein n=1 Tax=Evansella vedderi TaxID=38282 RepID=A0ABU0A091_9BACI|nr:branched-chain amino acid ABC transporter permease [Evansella vedderi]MDQ0256909.1 branched-chain amino acid transport system permease protein [Evansella vedderi]